MIQCVYTGKFLENQILAKIHIVRVKKDRNFWYLMYIRKIGTQDCSNHAVLRKLVAEWEGYKYTSMYEYMYNNQWWALFVKN